MAAIRVRLDGVRGREPGARNHPGPGVIYLVTRTLSQGRRPHDKAFRDGFWVALLNPKTAVFFAAFLPRFVDPRGSPLAQSLALGALFVAIAACTDTLTVLTADALGTAMAKLGGGASYVRYLAALSLVALGVLVACENPRTAR